MELLYNMVAHLLEGQWWSRIMATVMQPLGLNPQPL